MKDSHFKTLIQSYRESIAGKFTDEVRGMPNQAFTSEAYFNEEQRRLFGRTWIFAGTLSDIPNMGDIKPIQVAGRSLIITRDYNQIVHVFFNVCPHRGSQLIEFKTSGQKNIVCPYHCWTFSLDGKLRAQPNVDGMGNHRVTGKYGQESISLFPVRFNIWNDWVFVNIDGKALNFCDFIEPIRCKYNGYPIENLHLGTIASFDFESNFKLVMENWADNYHLFSVHPDLDKTMDNMDRKSMECVGPHIFCNYGFIGDSDTGIELSENKTQLPLVEDMSDEFIKNGALGTIFPNIALFASPVCFLFIHIRPFTADRSKMEVYFYYANEEVAVSSEFADARENLERQWAKLNVEDMEICRRTQIGRSCDDFDGGRFIPFWDEAHRSLNQHYADAMVGEGIFVSVNN